MYLLVTDTLLSNLNLISFIEGQIPIALDSWYYRLYFGYDAPFCCQASYETPYVVRLLNVNIIAEPQACFTFFHPNLGEYSFSPIPSQTERSSDASFQSSLPVFPSPTLLSCNLIQ